MWSRRFVSLLLVCLVGYAFLGRGFAYIGIPPLFIDTLIFGLALWVLVLNPGWIRMLRLPQIWLLGLYMVWGAICTIPYIERYGFDALRDGVLWAWGLIGIAVGYVVSSRDLFYGVTTWYSKWIRRFVYWTPLAYTFYRLWTDLVPRLPWGPGAGVPVYNPKGGDIAVHLVGILSFVVVVVPYLGYRQGRATYRAGWLFWLSWLIAFALIGFTGRGAFLTVILSLAFLSIHLRVRRSATAAILVASFIAFFALTGLEIDLGHWRKVSFEQLRVNVQSIIGEVEGYSGEGSKRWRLMWWTEILNYTFFGDYFWTGKGFGINLANDDGFQVYADSSLRSPHNGHLTILARSGVPGFTLWVLFQSAFSLSLWWRYFKLRRGERRFEAALCLWVMVYWMGAMINATFDVYLEGPQGGLWYWTIVGLGLGLLYKDRMMQSARISHPQLLPAARGGGRSLRLGDGAA